MREFIGVYDTRKNAMYVFIALQNAWAFYRALSHDHEKITPKKMVLGCSFVVNFFVFEKQRFRGFKKNEFAKKWALF
jgi:hypothetical protein